MSRAPLGKIRVGVLRGGPSPEYGVSLKTGSNVLRNLPEKYHPQDIFISRAGGWHIDGLERSPDKVLGHVDVVINALHGQYGEDGQVQQILERHGMPYTGSGISASALGINKALAKKAFQTHGIPTPYHVLVHSAEATDANVLSLLNTFSMPVIVKPVSAGSSIGVSLAADFLTLKAALESAFAHSESALVEEFIAGREATVGVIDGFRGMRHYSLMPIEIVHASHFFDYNSKYADEATREICPGHFTQEVSQELQRLAIEAHRALGLRHYSRSDFIVSNRGIYMLETNTLPGLTEQSLVPKSLVAVGATMPEFLDHLITLALES